MTRKSTFRTKENQINNNDDDDEKDMGTHREEKMEGRKEEAHKKYEQENDIAVR